MESKINIHPITYGICCRGEFEHEARRFRIDIVSFENGKPTGYAVRDGRLRLRRIKPVWSFERTPSNRTERFKKAYTFQTLEEAEKALKREFLKYIKKIKERFPDLQDIGVCDG